MGRLVLYIPSLIVLMTSDLDSKITVTALAGNRKSEEIILISTLKTCF